MEETNVRIMEDEELEDITKVEGAEESSSAGVLAAGVVGGFLIYVTVDGVRRLQGFVGAKLAEHRAAEKIRAEVVDVEYIEVVTEDSDEKDSER